MQILIRRSANLIDVSPDGRNPLPTELVAVLAPRLTYARKTFLRGRDAYANPEGRYKPVVIETKVMYRLDEGRFTCAAGFADTIKNMLRALGHHVRELDLTAEHHRPNRFQLFPNALDNVMQYRARQQDCVNAMDSNYGGIIKAPTGFGKTSLICAMALRYPYANIHIIAKQVAVATRIMRQLRKYLPNVGMLGGGKAQWGRVMVVTADSVHRSNGDADFLFADECHQLVTDNYANKLAELYRFSRNFGFSATPYSRMDGASVRLEGMFGPLLFDMSYQEAVQLGLVVPIEVKWLPIRMEKNPAKGKKETAQKRWGIWRNTQRNAILADEINKLPPNEQVLVLVETVEHAVHLWQHLKDFSLCYAEMKPEEFNNYKATGMLPQNFVDVTSEVRYNMQVAFEQQQLKKVIATDVWATGVDFAALQTVVRADARCSEILDTQGPGRAARIHDGKEYGTVIDTIDYWDDDFLRRSKARYKTYKELGWEQDWPLNGRQIAQAEMTRPFV